MRLEFDFLQVENDVDDVFDHVRERLKFMVGSRDFYCSNGSAFQRGKQHPAKGVSHGVPITGLEGLGNKLGVGICSGSLLFDEGLWHFETTEANWHNNDGR